MPVTIRSQAGIEPATNIWEYVGWGDPSVLGLAAGIGSTYVQLDSTPPGDMWAKTGATDTGWTETLALPSTSAVTADELAAMAGTSGAPSATNRFVTDSDTRLIGGGSTGGLPGQFVSTANALAGDGATDDGPALSTLANTTMAGSGTIYFTPGKVYRLATAITIPVGVTLWLPRGTTLKADGVTVTIACEPQAGLYPLFVTANGGSFQFFSGVELFPQWWGATPDGSHDDTAAIQAAATAASGAGGGTVTMPSGTYKLSLTGTSPGGSGHYSVSIPSNVTVRGVPGRTIFLNGGMTLGTPTTYYDAITLAAGTHDVTIDGLAFLGQNAPFSFESQLQMSCIEVQGTTCADVTVRNCTFDSQYGFTVHNEGGGQRIHVVGSTMRNCANGLNVNANYSMQVGNRLFDVESIEAGGAYTTISGNIIEGAGSATVGGISLGGNTSPGNPLPGVVCTGNVIIDSPGTGIAVADGITDAVVAGNTIIRSSNSGIELVSGGFNAIARVRVTGNVIADAGLTTGLANTRVGIYCQANTGGTISGNTVSYGVAAGHDTFYGIEIPGPIDGLTVTDNTLAASSTGIILPSGGNCTNLTLARNKITAPTPIDTSAVTITYATDTSVNPVHLASTLQVDGTSTLTGPITAPGGIAGSLTVTGTVNSATISTATIPTAAQLTGLTGGADTSLHFHSSDRARSNHTGTQSLSTIAGGVATGAGYTLPDLTVSGLLTANGGISGTLSQKSITANYTALTTDQIVLVDATAANITITLPAASAEGNREIFVKKIDASANTIRIAASGTDTIDGAASVTLATQYAWIDIIADGVGKWNISSASTTAVSVAASSVTPGSFASGGYTFPSTLTVNGNATFNNTGALSVNGNANFNQQITQRQFNAGNSGTALTLNSSNGNWQKTTLTGNCTLTITAPGNPWPLTLWLTQDATGSRTVTWPATVKWPGGAAPTLTTTAAKTDIVTLRWDGTSFWGELVGANY